ncbi:hypothetical protein G6F46_008766 [Rhizopus delemar]|uniref:CP-type G domain-containing protein n=2 Tax=Rhizopus TaxID=4842 RepID=A0A9P6Z370_9FUNG|nr:hypothetical protein G6F43_007582 [Rhizopus delemar]KAG1539637.1 hypothetical protein G6F51_009013 [Rhizopus arrhizus]KAG1454034.1 hypothetical protein G6F55_007822 [Rhizopus delemar]KAG1496595.1 hypothetical protein G6F54_006357 [Rhizopus delemar]KAG1507955.1 hypothetical protein G6F53_008556 [Rhizopus delemar]
MAPKKKQGSSLGRAVIKSRFQGQKAIALDEGKLHTTDIDEGPKWVKMQSITQENDLEAFLSTAALAETDFTAERLNVKVIQNDYNNPLLMNEEDDKKRIAKQEANVDKLSVPRRPQWDKSMTAEQVQRNERESFLDWRRSMAQLEDEEGLLLTPFEKNLEVWRQLWRVIERSQLIVQIVDARNPLLFRSADLEKYVKEVDDKKENLLLINKADFLTSKQRKKWADYFDSKGIKYTFFSAALAAKTQQEEEEKARQQEALEEQKKEEKKEKEAAEKEEGEKDLKEEDKDKPIETISDYLSKTFLNQQDEDDDRIRIRTTTNLLDLLIEKTPLDNDEGNEQKITIGLVGYPNVGKSSTINALIGEKRVSVSSTPGKTKHFQTIHLTPSLVLCDCPGLVFPTFSTTKADQVCNGVLPIDQLREHAGPCGLVAQRIPKGVLEATYGIRIRTVPVEDGGTGIPTSSELCSTYAIARGYFKSSQGNPDEARAARYILKDYVNGKLLFCHPPPNNEAAEFNKEIHEAALKVFKKLAPSTRVPSSALNYIAPADGTQTQGGSKTAAVDKAFFERQLSSPHVSGKNGAATSLTGGRVTLFPHQRLLADDGTPLPMSRKERMAIVQANLGDMGASKKHKKGKKHVKVRSGAGYDYM